ncbi:hypothetical protein [Xanthobacter sp. VNH20]|uniref:hypothetical protein n=1 Tax=Xanthobacter sp. VNH20 TaxID=3156616 RepID=UPI0032B34D7F
MTRAVMVYYAWSREAEAGAPLGVIEDRFPTLFESRRMSYPRFEELADPERFDQGVGGFLDHVMRRNFAAFVDLASQSTGRPVIETERGGSDGCALDACGLDAVDTLIVISFDSIRTGQQASDGEIAVIRRFLDRPGTVAFICPHHEIGEAPGLADEALHAQQLVDFLHHGDKTIPPRQRFGGFARSLLAGLGVPVENRFGLRPAAEPDGTPSPIEVESTLDRLGLLTAVAGLNLHAHLPQLERMGDAATMMDVLVRQKIDLAAPPHPFTRDGRATFDAILQSRPEAFAGTLLVCDTTLWSSTAGGVENLRRFWTNVLERAEES